MAKQLTLQIARYRFYWRVRTMLHLPPYAASTLRGVFGRALRELVCTTARETCRTCPLVLRCTYPSLFEPQTVAMAAGKSHAGMPALAAYAIETLMEEPRQLRPGDEYHFDMVLMTPDAIQQMAVIVAAWRHAFAKGIGKIDGKAELKKIVHLSTSGVTEPVYCAAGRIFSEHTPRVVVPVFDQAQDVELYFQTPLRIEHQGKLIRERDLTAGIFLRHMIRRVTFQASLQDQDAFEISDIHALNALADHVKEGKRTLLWHDWERYSSRQKTKMKLGGVVGYWQLLHVPTPLLALLYLGQWTHVGKESVFGLGKYRWKNYVASAFEDIPDFLQACEKFETKEFLPE